MEESPRISLRDVDQQSLAAWVQERGGTHHLPDDGPTDATDRLLACLLAIKAEIGLVDDRYIQRLANFILTRCHFLQIGAASLDDAYILFRSLNSRGLALNDLDIIRAEFGLILSPTPASAVPQWVEDAYWRYAVRIRPALDAREREGWIASCKADYTAGSLPPLRNSRDTNRNRY